MMQLGILQCDAVAPDVRSIFGDYPDMFRRLFTAVNPDLRFRVYNLLEGERPLSPLECDAWLFTGSKWSVYDDETWISGAHEIARELHEACRPTIGICFGHQLIARALGGRVEKAAEGWGVGVHTARVLQQREWMKPARRTMSLLVSHQDQVTVLPPGAELLASHAFCPYDTLQIDNHMLTFQGHPEFPKSYLQYIMRNRRERLGEDTYQEGMASLSSPTEEDVAASWILRFLERAKVRAA